MTFVVLQSCCNDASCVAVCPVNCIHPTPDEPGFMRAEMLHIDPESCIDCGACVDECPVDAIKAEEDLSDDEEVYRSLNSEYFGVEQSALVPHGPPRPSWRAVDFSDLRVAIVGSGPAAFYAASELCAVKAANVEMFEKLPFPYGLARFGVAPDHQSTKAVTDIFRRLGGKANFNLNLSVDIGRHLSHDELMEHHDAVVYAVGASTDRRLNIEGEDLPGSHAATDFVAWYNGHPDHADRTFDLSGERAVIIGNGNVALDVARILLTDPDSLARTDIADHALVALRNSRIREVTIVGRRGVGQAAYTNPEMLALISSDKIDVQFDDDIAVDHVTRALLNSSDTSSSVRAKIRSARAGNARNVDADRRLILRYKLSPTSIEGDGSVERVHLVRNRLEFAPDGAVVAEPTTDTETLSAGLIFRSIGYRGEPVPGLPFDKEHGRVPNQNGRVIDPITRVPVPGVYVTGWIKRGPTGVIGSNKRCAGETVDALLTDKAAGALPLPRPSGSIQELVHDRCSDAMSFADWASVDRAEKEAGKRASRPRVKFTDSKSVRDVVDASRKGHAVSTS